MRKVLYLLMLSFILSCSIFSSKLILIQQLHKKVSDDLLNIKKEFPKTQSTVYSLLDQVCKIYQVAKNNIEKKHKLMDLTKVKDEQYKILENQNNLLKNKLEDSHKELFFSKQSIDSLAKKIEKKELAVTMLSQEKTKLTQEKSKIEEKNKLLLKEQNNKLLEQNIDPHSLNLTSTSEPSSPL